MKENELIPELRFPKFQNTKGWKKQKLENAIESGNSQIALNNVSIKAWGYPLYGANGFIGFIEQFVQTEPYIAMIKDGSGVGRVFLCPSNSSIIGTLIYLKSRNINEYNLIWLFYLLNTINFKSFVKGSGIPHVYFSDIGKMLVPFPIYNEQQKIASCLSSLDRLISLEEEKLKVLKEHKKGLLQKLFPVKGKKLPELRFPEFKDEGEWFEKKMGELGKFIGGGTPSKRNIDYWKGDTPWISSSDLVENDISKIAVSRFISKEAIDNSATKIVPENSVLFISRVGVGKLAINKQPICTSQDFVNFIPEHISGYFVGYYFMANRKRLIDLVQGTSIKGFTNEDLRKINIHFPTTLEQHKIVRCLSSIDNIVQNQLFKIEGLKNFKSGLMQGLFPMMN